MELKDIKQFFEYDLLIKELIPTMRLRDDIFLDEDKIKFIDTVLDNIDRINIMFGKMCDILNNQDLKMLINLKLGGIKHEIENNSMSKYNEIYENKILKMSEGLDESLGENIKGYYLARNYINPFLKTNSINDILHLLHFSFINDENIYKDNIIESTNASVYSRINLIGEDTMTARKIFNNINANTGIINSGNIDILSFGKTTLIMARDLGHATTIEIEEEEEDYRIKYYIPKICNPLKVNEIKGVNMVKADASPKSTTTGEFVSKKDELNNEIVSLLYSLPTDEDIRKYQMDMMLKDEKGESTNEYGRY